VLALLRLVAIDVSPLRRYRNFRLRTVASCVSAFGSFFTMVAVPIQIKQLTDSTVAVGLIGAVEFLPIVAVGLLGGAIADRFDRRTVVLCSEVAALCCTALLLVNSVLPEPQLWTIYLVAAGAVSAGSMQRPSLDAMLPRYVGHADIPAASMLSNQCYGLANIAGTVAGGVLASISVSLAYAVDVASFGLSLLVFLRLTPLPRLAADVVPGVRATLASVGEGVRYAAGRKDLLGTYLVDTIAMTTAMPMALFPFFASTLHSPHAVGLLYAADSVGGLVAGAVSGWVRHVHRHGLAIAGCGSRSPPVARCASSGSAWRGLHCRDFATTTAGATCMPPPSGSAEPLCTPPKGQARSLDCMTAVAGNNRETV
jgi:MFS family permease